MNEPVNVLIIGGNAVGAKAASRIRRLNPNAHITILEQGRYISYAGCGLPYYVSGAVAEIDELVKTPYGRARDPEFFKQSRNIEVLTGRRAESIDRSAKTVRARNLETDETETYKYDKLVLAMGAAPVNPPIEGIDLKGVFHLTTMEDAAAVSAAVQENPGGDAVIIGAGFIGMEAAEALAARNWSVTILERYKQVFPWALDFEMAALVQEHLFEKMIEFELGAEVVRIERDADGNVAKVVTKEDEYDANLVILATGLKPNVDLALEAGLPVGETGALTVDEHLCTNDPDVYAGGDLVENMHLITGGKCYIPLGSTANKHGRVIADNICGIETPFPGVQGTFVCKVFDYAVGSTGLSETSAADAGLDAFVVRAPGFDGAHYYPGAGRVAIKLVVERGSGRLLGMQAVGAGDAARRIDIAATAIRFGATIDQIADLDLAYAPPYAQAMDLVITAANAARNVASGLLKPIDPSATRSALEIGNNVFVLDVRTPGEFAQGHIEGDNVVNIPIDDLRGRLGELPRDKKILCICSMGPRSYGAQRMLEAAGFTDVASIDGGIFLWPWKDELE